MRITFARINFRELRSLKFSREPLNIEPFFCKSRRNKSEIGLTSYKKLSSLLIFFRENKLSRITLFRSFRGINFREFAHNFSFVLNHYLIILNP